MNLQKCENGHFYDADKYQTCPHCQQLNDDQKTIGMTVPNDQPAPSVTPTMPQQPFAYAGGNTPSDDCLLYTSPSPRDSGLSRMPSSA